MCLFFTVPWVGMQYVIAAFPDHTNLLFEQPAQVHTLSIAIKIVNNSPRKYMHFEEIVN